MSLDEWRKEIDRIDVEIVRLLNMRARLCKEIGRLKREMGIPIVDLSREAAILKNVLQHSDGFISESGVVRIFREIIRESRNVQAVAWADSSFTQSK